MAIHKLLGRTILISGVPKPLQIGHLRADHDLGVASLSGISRDAHLPSKTDNFPAFLLRLSDLKVIRRMKHEEDFDEAILSTKATTAVPADAITASLVPRPYDSARQEAD